MDIIVLDTEVHVITVGEVGPPGSGGGLIDDNVVALDSTYSSSKIEDLLNPFALGVMSISPSTAEMGATVASVSLGWSFNKTPDTQSLNQGIGAIANNAIAHVHSAQTITTNRTYTLTAVRSGVTKTASATVSFLNRVYYGVHPSQTTDESIIEAMTNLLSGTRSRTITFDCTGGRFFHYAYPSRLGAATFQINNLTYSDVTRTTVSFTNASGFTEDYFVYYCNVIQNGAAIPLVVS